MTTTIAESTRDLEAEVTVIRLEQDYGSTQFLKLTRLETQLQTVLDASPKVLLLDLSETAFIGAAFLSVLIRCCTRATSINCRVGLCALQVVPADVVSMARLGKAWLMFDTRRIAVEVLSLSAMDKPAA
jgi:anti-anti-sigma regulatory factor